MTSDEWLTALDAHLRDDQAAAETRAGHRVEYLFAVDVDATRRGDGLAIRLLARHRRPDGTWDRPTHATITDDTPLLASPIDRRLLGPLLGARTTAKALATGSAQAVFTVPSALALDWVPLAARAGRLLLHDTPATVSTRPLQWDDGPSWQFELHAEAAEAPAEAPRPSISPGTRAQDTGHLVSGVFTRLADRLAVTGPVLVLDVGLLFTYERVAVCDTGPSFGVLSALRASGPLHMPASQSARLAQFLSRFGADPETVPPGLRVLPLHASPTPHLTVSPPHAPGIDDTDDTLRATLAFRYDGTSVPAGGESPVFDADRQRFIHRSADDELDAEAQLVEHGFSRERADDPTQWRVPARDLTAIVPALVADGWQVEAAGVPYRTPGTIHLSVTSGLDWFDLRAVVAFGDTSATLVDLLAVLGRGEHTVRLGDGSIGVLPEEWLRRYAPLASVGSTQEDGTIRFRPAQAALLDALLATQADAAEIQVDAAFTHLREQLATVEHPTALDPPSTFHGTLRSYQREGLGWLRFLRHFGFGGCLADDMGLGKTVTVLAELARVALARTETPDTPPAPLTRRRPPLGRAQLEGGSRAVHADAAGA